MVGGSSPPVVVRSGKYCDRYFAFTGVCGSTSGEGQIDACAAAGSGDESLGGICFFRVLCGGVDGAGGCGGGLGAAIWGSEFSL